MQLSVEIAYVYVILCQMKPTETNSFDKILRENLESVFLTLVRIFLGVQVIDSEEIPDDLQQTLERKPDFLKKSNRFAG
jgi:hypothetical protein